MSRVFAPYGIGNVSVLACGLLFVGEGCTLDLSAGDRDEEFASSMQILLDHGYRIEHVNGVGIVITPPADDTRASTLVVPDHFGSHTHTHLRYSDRHSQRTKHDRWRR